MLQSTQTFQNLVNETIYGPLSDFESFFDDALVDFVRLLTDSCTFIERKQTCTSFRNSNETFRLLLRMLLLSGCHKLADNKMY